MILSSMIIRSIFSPAFEQLRCSALWTLHDDTPLVDVGQWWYQEHEVDVVGLTDERTLIAGECKYQNSPADHSALFSLEDHVRELRWTPPDGDERDVEYALFSRSGFAESVDEAAEDRESLRLYTVDDVVAALTE
jgi:uncharacterized protein